MTGLGSIFLFRLATSRLSPEYFKLYGWNLKMESSCIAELAKCLIFRKPDASESIYGWNACLVSVVQSFNFDAQRLLVHIFSVSRA